MKTALFAVTVTGLMPTAAMAFDNTACTTFLIGTWVQNDDDALTATFSRDGKGSYLGHDVDVEIIAWSAAPGPTVATCTLTTQTDVRPEPDTDKLSVIDDNTFESARDGRFERQR